MQNKSPCSQRSHKTTSLQGRGGGEGSQEWIGKQVSVCPRLVGPEAGRSPCPRGPRLGHGQAWWPRGPRENEPELEIEERGTASFKVHRHRVGEGHPHSVLGFHSVFSSLEFIPWQHQSSLGHQLQEFPSIGLGSPGQNPMLGSLRIGAQMLTELGLSP